MVVAFNGERSIKRHSVHIFTHTTLINTGGKNSKHLVPAPPLGCLSTSHRLPLGLGMLRRGCVREQSAKASWVSFPDPLILILRSPPSIRRRLNPPSLPRRVTRMLPLLVPDQG